MTTRYYAETPCEHGMSFGPHIVEEPIHGSCPGGSRVELSVAQPDYEAAFQHLGVDNGSLVRSAVDAANEGLVLLAEDT